VVVLIPAHNEEDVIADALASLDRQTHPVDRCIVIADNCSDQTAVIAAGRSAEIFTTVGNRDKKAGALNQVLDALLPTLDQDDTLLIMDADTTLCQDFVEATLAQLHSGVGGVSGTFIARTSSRFIGSLQAMEYHRYRRQIGRRGGRAYVLSGTATLFRAGSLTAVRQARGDKLPDGDGVYDTISLTEDNELTLAMLTLGLSCPAPGVDCTTDVMETPAALFHQRHRWYLGALRNLRTYGLKLSPHLRYVYWRQQIGLVITALGLLAYISMLSLSVAFHIQMHFAPLWMIPLVVLAVERTVTVWKMGWRSRIIAATVIIEQIYSLFLMSTFLAACKDFVLGRKGSWQPT
jgi:cellulose synthase/poly-beta-1,6-N-acetylglucosamine synthase-like glycosyltransferase